MVKEKTEGIMELFTKEVISIIKNIPKGKVTTYGQIATLAGNPGGARQVARIIHSMSRKHGLPWFRVINSKGTISLPQLGGYEEQKMFLQNEGVLFDSSDRIDLGMYLWAGKKR